MSSYPVPFCQQQLPPSQVGTQALLQQCDPRTCLQFGYGPAGTLFHPAAQGRADARAPVPWMDLGQGKDQGVRRVDLNEGEAGKLSLLTMGQQGVRLQVETRHLHHAANGLGLVAGFPVRSTAQALRRLAISNTSSSVARRTVETLIESTTSLSSPKQGHL